MLRERGFNESSSLTRTHEDDEGHEERTARMQSCTDVRQG
jgi:hypothetical protein